MTHVEELCRKLETAYLAIDIDTGKRLRAALVADKAESSKPPPQPRPSEGMSRAELRQRAAIAAMQSLLTVEGNPDTVDELVVHAVRCADALVAELEKKP